MIYFYYTIKTNPFIIYTNLHLKFKFFYMIYIYNYINHFFEILGHFNREDENSCHIYIKYMVGILIFSIKMTDNFERKR